MAPLTVEDVLGLSVAILVPCLALSSISLSGIFPGIYSDYPQPAAFLIGLSTAPPLAAEAVVLSTSPPFAPAVGVCAALVAIAAGLVVLTSEFDLDLLFSALNEQYPRRRS
ncbi:hypothetical protein C8R43DRAFT_959671 [Mycena crocata]|nr:hypothetical protein C8R43DRAFT_959671 [Mycena crocata]